MAIGPKSKVFRIAFLSIVLSIMVPSIADAQLITYLDTVQTNQNNDSISISIYVDNYSGDSITGYTLWISLAYADFIGFYSDSVMHYDTTYENCLEDSCILWNQDSTICLYYTCISWADTIIDSAWVQRGAIDTTGDSQTSGWDFVDATILDAQSRSVKINAIANQGNPYTPGIPSPTSQGLLCKILAEVKESPDTCPLVEGVDTTWVPCCFTGGDTSWLPWDECFCDSIIGIRFDTAQTRFSNEHGQFIGWVWEDTAWTCVNVPPDFHTECVRKCGKDTLDPSQDYCNDSVCAYMYPPETGFCYLWECLDCDIWDSSGHVDPQQVLFVHGQIEVLCSNCDWIVGDANYDDVVNVSDAVFIINYVFTGGDEPLPVLQAGDANCDFAVNVSDAVYIINYVFTGGDPPPCTCDDLL
jgi:hypothetical protein